MISIEGIEDMHYLAKGRRGVVYRGVFRDRQVVIKYANPESRAMTRIENEANWLRILNRKGIGPELIRSTPDYLVEEFIEGEFIEGYASAADRKTLASVIIDILKQCFEMDRIGVTKEEMHRPLRHIIVTEDNRPVMIDFERCRRTEKPKNVSQFCQFLAWTNFSEILKAKGISIGKDKIRELADRYKDSYSPDDFARIIDIFSSC